MTSWQLDGFDELHELGVGGGGRVVLARHIESGRLIAIKYLAAWLATSEERLAAFRSEAELMAGLVDPNLVTLYEYLETDAGAAIVMELVEGVALRDMLEHGGPLTPQAALTVMKGSLLGLATLHRKGIVHRDYKPENVMVSGDGCTKLVDYGIAAPIGELAGIAGTPLYMAPEQWVGEPSTAASDVYAATATFVELLTGEAVYTGGTTDALRHQHLMAAPALDAIPATVRSIAEAGLAKHPDERIGDAEALVQRLDTVARDAYGPDWEKHGRLQLAARASALALLFPRRRFQLEDHGRFNTRLGDKRAAASGEPRRRGLWGAGIAAGVLAVAGFAGGAAAATTDQASAAAAVSAYQSLPATVVSAPPTPAASPKPKPKPKTKPKPKATLTPPADPIVPVPADVAPAPVPYTPPVAPVVLPQPPPAPAPMPIAIPTTPVPSPTSPAPTEAPPATQSPAPPTPTWSPPSGPRRGGVPIRITP